MSLSVRSVGVPKGANRFPIGESCSGMTPSFANGENCWLSFGCEPCVALLVESVSNWNRTTLFKVGALRESPSTAPLIHSETIVGVAIWQGIVFGTRPTLFWDQPRDIVGTRPKLGWYVYTPEATSLC